MTLSPRQETAKIYQFPVKHRPPAAIDRAGPRRAEPCESRTARTDFGSGWYHEAAMQESRQDGKH